MPNHIINNAYRILGLDNSASQRDIMKRYREIINRLKIDDRPQYDLDLNLSDTIRTENSVDNALKKLQNHRSNLTEYFFWFSISDTVDEKAFERLRYGDATSCDQAAQIWKDCSQTENSIGLSYKKNLAILYCLSMFNEENDAILEESILVWKEIVNADRFWASFRKKYAMNSSSEVHQDVVNDLRKNIIADICDVYYDLYIYHNNTKYVRKFQSAFGTLGLNTEKRLFKPIRQSIHEAAKNLYKIGEKNDSDLEEPDGVNTKCDNCESVVEHFHPYFRYKDGSYLCTKCRDTIGLDWRKKINSMEIVEGSGKKLRQIKKTIKKLELNLKRLDDLGLYDADQSMVLRDHVAETIRNVSAMLYNQHMRETSLELVTLAKRISATAATRESLESDLTAIAGSIARDKQNTIVAEWGFLNKKKLTVTETFIEYQDSRIYYSSANVILYYQSGRDYHFSIGTSNDKIHFKLDYSHRDVLNRAVPLAVPHIIRNLVRIIFEKNQVVFIKNIRFDKMGYHRSRTFRKDESVLWSEFTYLPQLTDRRCFLFKKQKNTFKRFTSVSLQEPNAVIIPRLTEACYEFYLHQS